MELIWTLIRIVVPVLLAFSSIIFSNDEKGLLIAALCTAFFSIYSFFSDASRNKKHKLEIEKLTIHSNNLKNKLHLHNQTPHDIATAVIDVSKNPPKLITSHNVIDVVDKGTGNFLILVDAPFSDHLVPKLESDCDFTKSISIEDHNHMTGISVKWSGGEPVKVFFTLASGDGYINV